MTELSLLPTSEYDERESHDVAMIVAIRPIQNTPPAVLFDLWHDQPFAPCIEPIKVNHDDHFRRR